MADCLDITDSAVNSFKLYILLINGGTTALRRLFDEHVPDLNRFLNANQAKIDDLLRKRFLTKSQRDKLYPAVGNPSSDTFDISLLVSLLRNVCNIRAPSTGWGTKPAAQDRSVEGAVAIIHWYRNNVFSHTASMEIPESSFESSWKEISEAIERLGENRTHVEKLKATPLSVSICVEKLTKCEFSGDVAFHANRHYPETREWVFSHVDKWFVDRTSDSRVLIISGNAGMGKSVIAGELCRRMKERQVLGAIHFCQHKDQRRRNPKLMLQSLARHLCDNLPGFKAILTGQLNSVSASAVASMNVEELFTLLLEEPANMMSDPGKNILLLVDGLDECECDGRNELLDAIARLFYKLPSWIKFLMTGRPEMTMEKKLKHLQPFVLSPLDNKNQRDIETFFKGELSHIFPSSDLERNVRRFVNQADGLMLYAYYFIEFVKEHQKTLKPEDFAGIYPQGISSVYDQYFHRLQNELNVPEEKFHSFLSALGAARAPLPVSMAFRILGFCHDSQSHTMRLVEKTIGPISRLLPIRDGCIYVFHKSIIDWLSCPELYGHHRFTVVLRQGDAVLSDECERAYKTIEKRSDIHADFSPEENYALQQGTFHLIADLVDNNKNNPADESQVKRVYRYARSLGLLHAKLQSTVDDAVYSVIEELTYLKPYLHLPEEDALELDDCISCLRRHAYELAERPVTIFQLLANEAETVAVSLEACKIMHLPKYETRVRLEVVNRSHYKDPVVSKFKCETSVNCCAVLQELALLACGCARGLIRIFSLKTGKELWSAKEDEVEVWPEEERCNYCVFLPPHSVLIHGRFDRAFAYDGSPQDLFPNNHHTFIDSCCSPNKKRLLTRNSHLTSEIMMWDIYTGDQLACLTQSTCSITCCVFSLCGRYVISGSFDHGISVWNTIPELTENPTHNWSCCEKTPLNVDCLAKKEGNSHFVVINVSKKQSFKLFEFEGGNVNPPTVSEVDLGPDHSTLGVSADGNRLYVCGYANHIPSQKATPFSVRFVQVPRVINFDYVTDVGSDRVLLKSSNIVYLCQTVENTSSSPAFLRDVRAVSFSIDGSHVYVLFKEGLSMYEASSGQLAVSNTSVKHGKCFSLSPSGEEIMIRRRNDTKPDVFEIWDCHLDKQIKTFHLPSEIEVAFQYIDNSRVLFFSQRGFPKILNVSSLVLERTILQHSSRIQCFDVFLFKLEENKSNVAHYCLFACDIVGGLFLYDTAKDFHTRSLVSPEEAPKCCSFFPDGSATVTGHVDGSIRIWDSSSLQLKKTLEDPSGVAIKGCGFLIQDLGTLVVTGTKEGLLRVWDGFSRQELCKIEFESELRSLVTSPVKGQICVALVDSIVILNAHVPDLE